ncbi:tRNA adenosine deaminase [Corynebacterium sp. 13CS0277]|uniref:tRNA adenosine deaminase-associated protein n=1 Tax=Corynebacterium sp. 13CS0277 TaxID=2071994 RepID=UPI000D03C2AD|nr:tRNA adenosine deaminase-associated protein [Corynebacterium sp. 13CS0277]PRQ10303.1 tRNA adenosine deaminase [Corynebacterium sp. 13CS0277]
MSNHPTHAVLVTFHNGWAVENIPAPATVDEAATRVRRLRSEGTAFAVVTVGDEYFTIVRPTPRGVELFVSDGFAALDDDFGVDALATLGELEDVEDAFDALDWPEDDDEAADESVDDMDIDPYPVGNFEILADMGLAEPTLTVLVDDPDLWAHEQLAAIEEDLGCDLPWT